MTVIRTGGAAAAEFTADPAAAALEAARALAPEIRARAREGEQLRTMPADLADRIEAAGLFALWLPRSVLPGPAHTRHAHVPQRGRRDPLRQAPARYGPAAAAAVKIGTGRNAAAAGWAVGRKYGSVLVGRAVVDPAGRPEHGGRLRGVAYGCMRCSTCSTRRCCCWITSSCLIKYSVSSSTFWSNLITNSPRLTPASSISRPERSEGR